VFTKTRVVRVAALAAAIAFPLSLAACGTDSAAPGAGASSSAAAPASSAPMTSAPASPSASESMMTDEPFGAACTAVPKSGKGSFDGMSTDPVATAASNNPLLTTLVAAVKEAGLVDTLNGAKDITVFAPTDDAFAEIPKADLGKVLADKKTLTSILTYHVVPRRLGPADLAGTHETLQGDSLTVSGSGEMFQVDGKSSVICGNVQTANATVYIVDSVLMPKS